MRACTVAIALVGPLFSAAAQPAGPATTSPTALPDPPRLAAFQPGVQIDWSQRSVHVAAQVVLRDGPLELLACFHSKEHESVLRAEASAVAIYQALGLVGLSPGAPPRWDEAQQQFSLPTGDLVDISIESATDAVARRVPYNQWLLEIEFERPPLALPFVFAGSRRVGNDLLAQQSGVAIALVDFGDSLLTPPASHVSRDAELWVAANPSAIPHDGAAVTLVLRAAAPVPTDITIDPLGRAYVGPRMTVPRDILALLHVAQQIEPDRRYTIEFHRTLAADRARWRAIIAESGIPAERIDWRDAEPPATGGAGDSE